MIRKQLSRQYGLLYHCLIGLLLIVPLTSTPAQETDNSGAGNENGILTGDEIITLQGSLAEMKKIAPKLRVMLRSLRTQVGIDTRQVFNIERSISQSQKDIERLIAMHQRNAVNQMRAHFLADDMRRKAEALKDSLAYVVKRAREHDSASAGQQGSDRIRENNDALVEMLGRYSAMVEDNLAMIQERTR